MYSVCLNNNAIDNSLNRYYGYSIWYQELPITKSIPTAYKQSPKLYYISLCENEYLLYMKIHVPSMLAKGVKTINK